MLHAKLQKLGDNEWINHVKIPDAKALMKELDALLDELKIGELCETFIIDCDSVKDRRKHFTNWEEEKVACQRERSVSSIAQCLSLQNMAKFVL